MNPKVTVCVPCFNGEKFIERTLESILNQTFDNFECILMNNCSTDNTCEKALKFVSQYDNFKIITNETQLSAEDNFNKCLNYAEGEYVCLYHADDVYDPTILSNCVKFLEENSRCGAVSTMGTMIDSEDRDLDKQFVFPKQLKKLGRNVFDFQELFSVILRRGGNSFIICPSVMLRKKIIHKLGGFEYDKFSSSSDVALWLKISQDYGMGVIQKRLIKYRIHTGQVTQWIIRDLYSMPDLVKVVKYYKKQIDNLEITKLYNCFIANQAIRLALKRIRVSRLTYVKPLFYYSLNSYTREFPVLSLKSLETLLGLIFFWFLYRIRKTF